MLPFYQNNRGSTSHFEQNLWRRIGLVKIHPPELFCAIINDHSCRSFTYDFIPAKTSMWVPKINKYIYIYHYIYISLYISLYIYHYTVGYFALGWREITWLSQPSDFKALVSANWSWAENWHSIKLWHPTKMYDSADILGIVGSNNFRCAGHRDKAFRRLNSMSNQCSSLLFQWKTKRSCWKSEAYHTKRKNFGLCLVVWGPKTHVYMYIYVYEYI